MDKGKVKNSKFFRCNLKLEISNSFYKGFLFAFLFLGVLGVLTAVGFHTANEILGGNFSGNFIFKDNVTFEGQVSGISSGSGVLFDSSLNCNSSTAGNLKYNSSKSKFFACNGINWREISLGSIEYNGGGNDEDTTLLLHMDDLGLTDSAIGAAGSNNVVLSSVSRNVDGIFGGYGAYFNGASYMTISDSTDWEFGTDDFTIDLWIKPMAANEGWVMSRGYPASAGQAEIVFQAKPGNILAFQLYFVGYADGAYQDVSFTFNIGQWYHIAVTRESNLLKMYVDGVLTDIEDIGSKEVRNTGTLLYLGKADSMSSYYYTGYIDEFRISKGVRWTENFEVPTGPYS